jgi:hypothetical protein
MTGIEAGKTWSRIGAEVAPTSDAASGVWGSLNEVSGYVGAGTWPAPIISWEAIATSSGSSVSTISFTSIPQTYTNLKVMISASTSTSSGNNFNVVTINNQPSIGYNIWHLNVYGGTNGWSTNGAAIGSEWYPAISFPNSEGNADTLMNNAEYFFPGYSSTTLYKPSTMEGMNRKVYSYAGTQAQGGPLVASYTAEDLPGMTRLDMVRYGGNWTDYEITLFGIAGS